jgi:hypothetical protein
MSGALVLVGEKWIMTNGCRRAAFRMKVQANGIFDRAHDTGADGSRRTAQRCCFHRGLAQLIRLATGFHPGLPVLVIEHRG